MTSRENELIKRLEKRLDWLRKRIYTDSKDKTDLSYDRAEADALEWAIGIISKNLGINDTPEGCKHTWNLLKAAEIGRASSVFCIKCRTIEYLE